MAKNTKTTIYPVFAKPGETIDLKQYAPDAGRIIFDVGYRKPSYLSINTDNELMIASNAVTETTPVYVALKAINHIDATETGSFGFYLIIQADTAPVWRDVPSLTMPGGSTYDLYQIVEGADSVAFKSGATQPTAALYQTAYSRSQRQAERQNSPQRKAR